MISGLLQDLRYALRQLRKSRGLTVVAVITLALGIGANTAVFSVVDAVMLRPLPYYQPERLIEAESVNTHNPQPTAICYPDFFDWRSQNRTLEHLVSYRDNLMTLTGLERPVQVDAEVVSWDLLPALGIRPELGRGFTADEEKAGTKVVLISHALWTTQFGGDPAIVGRGIRLSGDLYTVIGVMPPSFRFPVNKARNGIWTTLAADDDPSDPKPNTSKSRLSLLERFRTTQTGGHGCAGGPGSACDCDESSKAVSRYKHAARLGSRRNADRSVNWGHANLASGCAGRSCSGSSDRLRQHRKPAAGADERAAARDRGSFGARCR